MTFKLPEFTAVPDYINAQVISPSGTLATTWITPVNDYNLTYYLQCGYSDCSIDAKLQQAKDGSGTSAKDITGKAITTHYIVPSYRTGDFVVIVCLRPEEMDFNNGFTYTQLQVTVGGQGAYGTDVAILAITMKRDNPASVYDSPFVTQIVL